MPLFDHGGQDLAEAGARPDPDNLHQQQRLALPVSLVRVIEQATTYPPHQTSAGSSTSGFTFPPEVTTPTATDQPCRPHCSQNPVMALESRRVMPQTESRELVNGHHLQERPVSQRPQESSHVTQAEAAAQARSEALATPPCSSQQQKESSRSPSRDLNHRSERSLQGSSPQKTQAADLVMQPVADSAMPKVQNLPRKQSCPDLVRSAASHPTASTAPSETIDSGRNGQRTAMIPTKDTLLNQSPKFLDNSLDHPPSHSRPAPLHVSMSTRQPSETLHSHIPLRPESDSRHMQQDHWNHTIARDILISHQEGSGTHWTQRTSNLPTSAGRSIGHQSRSDGQSTSGRPGLGQEPRKCLTPWFEPPGNGISYPVHLSRPQHPLLPPPRIYRSHTPSLRPEIFERSEGSEKNVTIEASFEKGNYPPTSGGSLKRQETAQPDAAGLGTRCPEEGVEDSPPMSPQSVTSSVAASQETPMTSPSQSPTKGRPSPCRFGAFVNSLAQLDDLTDGFERSDSPALDNEPSSSNIETEGAAETFFEVDGSTEASDDVFFDSASRVLDSESWDEHCSNVESEGIARLPPRSHQPSYLRPDEDEFTPLVTPSFAKGAAAFPFPRHPGNVHTTPIWRQSRYPSALLGHCERNATPRQKRLMTEGAHAPDRFITNRAGTPTKESLLLSKQRPKPAGHTKTTGQSDPFGPVPARSLRMAEQYATIRSPPPAPHPVGVASRVRDSAEPVSRAPSLGTVWTVGGSLVTEGVASTTNGRGGRITSGTNASHYTADFIRKNSMSEDEVTHSRRLAVAMGIDQDARIMAQGSPASPTSPAASNGSLSPRSRIWKDGGWQQDGVATPTKPIAKVVKDVPVIPFRVLNAPALRDDYYCSLLSYSPTVHCLAVGLGPHVYLWSEKRTSTGIPDSLTAPAGSAHVTSVSFSSKTGGSAVLAIGRADGRITLWSPLDREPRFDSEQPAPISCLSFRPEMVCRPSLRDTNVTVMTEELLVGDEIGFVYYYSIEWPTQDQRDLFDWHGSMTLLARIECHSQQVCSIVWSAEGQYFATGGNDNQLFLFESKRVLQPAASRRGSTGAAVRVRAGSSTTVTGQDPVLSITPGRERHIFTLNAAVKAMAFAPWQSTLLAAGGGSNDRCIHFFHTLSGATLATIDCHAQVTSLVWSEKRKEIAGTFGFAQPEHPYRVAVFAWPSCNIVVRIPWWSEERALFGVAYPRGPGTGKRREGARRGDRAPDANAAATGRRTDAEGRPWYGRRTREEGCLVVATSDASIKFHEIWAEHSGDGGKRVESGVFGGSRILEEEYTGDVERWGVIR